MDVRIKKNFGGFSLDVAFQHQKGVLGVLGESGCGKSMLLKCIAGIMKPDSGHISWNQTVLYDSYRRINLKTSKRKVGYLFQNYALFPKMTVAENIAISLGKQRAKEKERFQKQIQLFRLEGLEDRYPYQLSGGQQQRVALARMFLYEPDVILLDEPFSALDYYLKEKLEQELIEILSSYKGQVIIVSHNRDELYRLCEELVVMDQGKIIVKGKTSTIFDEPQKLQAARLTGCKNISEVKRIGERKLYAIDWGIYLDTNEDIGEHIRYVGIRAHHVKLASTCKEVNTYEIESFERVEMPFERQTITWVKTDQKRKKSIWISSSKTEGLSDVNYLTLNPCKLMLLEE